MTTTNIKALKPFAYRDSGEVFSIGMGEVVEVDSTLATGFIGAGLAEVYTLITPKNNLAIDENGTYDVTQYAGVTVDVDILTVTYNANGGTGTVAPVSVAAGDAVELSDGTGLTAPESKEFVGWAKTSGAQSATVTSPYTPTESITLYAVYADVAPEGTE